MVLIEPLIISGKDDFGTQVWQVSGWTPLVSISQLKVIPKRVIIFHDYQSPSCPGVRMEVDEFFNDKPQVPLELWHFQAVIVK